MEEETHRSPGNLLRSYHTLVSRERVFLGEHLRWWQFPSLDFPSIFHAWFWAENPTKELSIKIPVHPLEGAIHFQTTSLPSWTCPVFYLPPDLTCCNVWYPNSPSHHSQPHRGNQNCTKPPPPVVINIKGIWIFASEILENPWKSTITSCILSTALAGEAEDPDHTGIPMSLRYPPMISKFQAENSYDLLCIG